MFRVDQHINITSNPLFVTLTYNNQNLPFTESGVPTLKKKDIQDFMKRLRERYKKISNKKISYFFVGEYGKLKNRPHYHAIIFNLDNPELITEAWKNPITKESIGRHEYPPLDLNNQSGLGYLLKYLHKPKGKYNDGRLKEFTLVSKGIGENYLSKNMVQFHSNNLENCYVIFQGKKLQMPKYYKEKLYSSSNGDRESVTKILQNRYEKKIYSELKKRWENAPYKPLEQIINEMDISKLLVTFDRYQEKL